MFAPAGRITARAGRLCRLAALVVRRQAVAPWNPNYVGRGRAGLKNRQDTFFDAPPTRSRLTAPPKNLPPGRGGARPARDLTVTRKLRVSNVGRGLDPSLPFGGYRIFHPHPARSAPPSPKGEGFCTLCTAPNALRFCAICTKNAGRFCAPMTEYPAK